MPPDYPVISDDELERLEDDYVEAARLAPRPGFRAVDIKATHGYLLSELLGAKTREGRYGGSLENRARFIRNVIGKIRAALGEPRSCCACGWAASTACPTRATGHRRSACRCEYSQCPTRTASASIPTIRSREDLAEVKQAIGWFREWGVQLLNISMGSPYYNPHIGRPFEKPDEGNYEQPEHPLAGRGPPLPHRGRTAARFPRPAHGRNRL